MAMNTAYEMGDDQCWHRLGVEALRQGTRPTSRQAGHHARFSFRFRERLRLSLRGE